MSSIRTMLPPPARVPFGVVQGESVYVTPEWARYLESLNFLTNSLENMASNAQAAASDSVDVQSVLSNALMSQLSPDFSALDDRINAVESQFQGTMLFSGEIAEIKRQLDELRIVPPVQIDESAINALRKRVEALEAVVVITTGPDNVAITSKGDIDLVTPGGRQAKVLNVASAVNYLEFSGSAAGGGPSIAAKGTDANITISMVPKGAGFVALGGSVRFGGMTASVDVPIVGYMVVQDMTGTNRKLAVIA